MQFLMFFRENIKNEFCWILVKSATLFIFTESKIDDLSRDIL